jgi:hypothetical protein
MKRSNEREVWKRWKQEEVDQKAMAIDPGRAQNEVKQQEHVFWFGVFIRTCFYLILGLGFGFVVIMIQLILRIKL